MKRIKMLRTVPGSEECTGVTKDYLQGQTYTVSETLADAFARLAGEPCVEVLSDTEEDELLGKDVADDARPALLTDAVIDDAVRRHVAGEFNLDYVVANMSAHFKVDPVELRAKLEDRVAALKKATEPSSNKNERQGRTRNK